MKKVKNVALLVLAVSSFSVAAWGVSEEMRMNHVPVATAKSVDVKQGTTAHIQLSATDADGDSLTYALVERPKHGVLGGIAPKLTYLPESGYVGKDGFKFRVNDGKASSKAADIKITVRASSQEGTKGNLNNIVTKQGGPAQINLDAIAGVTEKEVSYVIQQRPKHGRITGIAPNMTYLPNKGYVGEDSFIFGIVNHQGRFLCIKRVTIAVEKK